MKRKFKIWLISIVVIGVGLNLFMFIYVQIAKYHAKALYKEVANHDKFFVYETYTRALNPVFYVENLEDTSALITYYQRLAKLDTATNYINFEIQMLITTHEPIYVYKPFNKSSNIVQFIDFDKGCWGYMKGYLYKGNTHIVAPPDSLVNRYELFWAKQNSDPHQQMINRITKKISPYGWYCN